MWRRSISTPTSAERRAGLKLAAMIRSLCALMKLTVGCWFRRRRALSRFNGRTARIAGSQDDPVAKPVKKVRNDEQIIKKWSPALLENGIG